MGRFRVDKYKIKTDKNINKRICFISDIHHDKYIKISFYNELLSKISKCSPDYIILGGDIIDNGKALEKGNAKDNLEWFISELGKITKTVVTVGNHDLQYSYRRNDERNHHLEWFSTLTKFKNVYYIFNESIIFKNLEIIHYTPTSKWFKNLKKDAFYHEFRRYPITINENNNYKVFISHSPVSITRKHNYEKLPEITNNIDLILSGHMHNGLLPDFMEFLDKKKVGRGIISPSKSLFPDYCRGKHKIKNMNIIISRGITKFSWLKIFKIFDIMYKSEITLIDLK